ncbi:MAG: hypothetical protein IT204_02720 [Fimbriimonadaceae bacterium]|nr:hypothetical protein [Fimbriimonadaceae bacterium]
MLRSLVPIVSVVDVLATAAFYERMGFVKKNHLEHEGQVTWAFLQHGEVSLMLGLGHDHDETGADIPLDHSHGHREVILYFYTSQLEQVRETWLAAGVECSAIEVQPYEMREFSVVDPDGYLVLVGQSTTG